MDLASLIRLIIYTLAACVLTYVVQIPFRKIENRFIKAVLFLFKSAATLFLGLALIAFDYKIIWRHEYAFAALYLALIPDIFADLFLFPVTPTRRSSFRSRSSTRSSD